MINRFTERCYIMLYAKKDFLENIIKDNFNLLRWQTEFSTQNVISSRYLFNLILKKLAGDTLKTGRHEKPICFWGKFNDQNILYKKAEK